MVLESLMKIMSPSLSFVVGGTMTMLTLTEAPLFARVTPDECTWTVDSGAIVVTMQKAEPRPWASLALC